MKLWDVIKIVSGILIVKAGCRAIDAVYVYLTDDKIRKAVFDAVEKDQQTVDTEEIEEDTVIMGFQA